MPCTRRGPSGRGSCSSMNAPCLPPEAIRLRQGSPPRGATRSTSPTPPFPGPSSCSEGDCSNRPTGSGRRSRPHYSNISSPGSTGKPRPSPTGGMPELGLRGGHHRRAGRQAGAIRGKYQGTEITAKKLKGLRIFLEQRSLDQGYVITQRWEDFGVMEVTSGFAGKEREKLPARVLKIPAPSRVTGYRVEPRRLHPKFASAAAHINQSQ